MPTSVRNRVIPASQQAVWELIADPHHQPRWWPGVERVESVAGDRFTQVLTTKRGRPVRADFRVTAAEPPWMAAWTQVLAGTPFARVLQESVIQLNLESVGDSTAVTITHTQKLRGYSRTGGLMLRGASSSRLDEALEGLAQLL